MILPTIVKRRYLQQTKTPKPVRPRGRGAPYYQEQYYPPNEDDSNDGAVRAVSQSVMDMDDDKPHSDSERPIREHEHRRDGDRDRDGESDKEKVDALPVMRSSRNPGERRTGRYRLDTTW